MLSPNLGDLECSFLALAQVHLKDLWALEMKFCPDKTSISKAQDPFSYVDFLFVLNCKN